MTSNRPNQFTPPLCKITENSKSWSSNQDRKMNYDQWSKIFAIQSQFQTKFFLSPKKSQPNQIN